MNRIRSAVVAGLCIGLAASGGWAWDDGHGHADSAPPKPAPAKAPAEFGIGAGTTKKDAAAKPARSDVEAVDGPVSAEAALKLLREGNERWIAGAPASPATTSSRRRLTAEGGQHPFATILTCADSRLPVERVFDRGVGELFVLRVAGNIVGTNEAGTIEYGATHLNVPLLVVMGHTKCGAVAAAAASASENGHGTPPNIAALIESIRPAVARARKAEPEADEEATAAAAVRENVWQSIFDLIRSSGPVRGALREGKLTIVGAVCDVATGKVEWLGEHPWQAELVTAFETRAQQREAVATAETEAATPDTHGGSHDH